MMKASPRFGRVVRWIHCQTRWWILKAPMWCVLLLNYKHAQRLGSRDHYLTIVINLDMLSFESHSLRAPAFVCAIRVTDQPWHPWHDSTAKYLKLGLGPRRVGQSCMLLKRKTRGQNCTKIENVTLVCAIVHVKIQLWNHIKSSVTVLFVHWHKSFHVVMCYRLHPRKQPHNLLFTRVPYNLGQSQLMTPVNGLQALHHPVVSCVIKKLELFRMETREQKFISSTFAVYEFLRFI